MDTYQVYIESMAYGQPIRARDERDAIARRYGIGIDGAIFTPGGPVTLNVGGKPLPTEYVEAGYLTEHGERITARVVEVTRAPEMESAYARKSGATVSRVGW